MPSAYNIPFQNWSGWQHSLLCIIFDIWTPLPDITIATNFIFPLVLLEFDRVEMVLPLRYDTIMIKKGILKIVQLLT